LKGQCYDARSEKHQIVKFVQRKGHRPVIALKRHVIRASHEWRRTSTRVSPWHERERG